MASEKLQKLRSDITKKLHEPGPITDKLELIEKKTGVDRFYMVAGVAGALALYMIFGFFRELICNLIGFLYPAYISIKAIESSDKKDDTQWLTYWVIFALFNVIEFASDFICGWFPFYWLVKCIFMVWLHLPMTKGAEKVYAKFVRPFVLKHQSTIDQKIGQAANTIGEKVGEVGDHFKPN